MQSGEFISIEKIGHVLAIGLNRPTKMNAFRVQMLEELAQAYTYLEDKDDLRCGLLFAHGKHFTGGLDLAEVGPYIQSGKGLFNPEWVDPCQIYGRKRSKPMVVAVQGYCYTIGIELILAADICIAGSDAVFAQIEIQRGIFPFGGATIRMLQRAGWGNAMRYLLTGDRFDAHEAHRIGIVQEVVEENPYKTALALAKNISDQAPLGVYATLKSAQITLEQGPEAAKAALEDEARKLMASEDAAEGMRSFIERRKGIFKGK